MKTVVQWLCGSFRIHESHVFAHDRVCPGWTTRDHHLLGWPTHNTELMHEDESYYCDTCGAEEALTPND